MGKMPDDDMYSLRWDAQRTSILGAIALSHGNDYFADVTIMSDDQVFKAHKIILAASSPYLRKMLESTPPSQHVAICLPHISATDIEYILKFIYQGEIKIGKQDLAKFVSAAKLLHIRGMDSDYDSTTDTFPSSLGFNPQSLAHNLFPFENLQQFQNGLWMNLLNMRDQEEKNASHATSAEDSNGPVFPKTLPTFSREGSPFSTTSSISSKEPKSIPPLKDASSADLKDDDSNLSGGDSLVIDTDRDDDNNNNNSKTECNNNEVLKGGMVINPVNLEPKNGKPTDDQEMDDEDFTPIQPEVSFRESDEAIGGLGLNNSKSRSSTNSPRNNISTPPAIELPLSLKSQDGSMSICPTTVPTPKFGTTKKMGMGSPYKLPYSSGLRMAPPPPPMLTKSSSNSPNPNFNLPLQQPGSAQMQFPDEFLKNFIREQQLMATKPSSTASSSSSPNFMDFGPLSSGLRKHKRYVQCSSCNKVLSSLSALKRHMEDVHCARIQGKCLICERVYSSRNSLLTHVYSAHKKHHDYKAVARIIRESDFGQFVNA